MPRRRTRTDCPHLYRHYLLSPGRLGLWVKTANGNYLYARARVVNAGIRRARAQSGIEIAPNDPIMKQVTQAYGIRSW
jgi:hypothetical protein